VIIKSMQDSQVVGRLVTVTSCWVATTRGLSVISPRIPQTSYEPLVPAAERVNVRPSVGFSIMDLFHSAGSSASSSTAVVSSASSRPPPGTTPRGVVALPRGPVSIGVTPPPIGGPTWNPSSDTLQAPDIFSPARQDRYEAARGLRTLLGHNSSRLMDITNNTGNCGDDRAFNNVIVAMLPDDRSLPALSRQQLKHLLTLQFALTYESAKPTGIHLQAFRARGAPFQYVIQIHDALIKMVRVMDNIRDPYGPAPRFFYTLFGPLLELLSSSEQVGLSKLPTTYVVAAVSDVLLLFGCKANCPAADNWLTADAQFLNLAPSLVIDVARHLSIASLDALSMHHKKSESDKSRTNRSAGSGRSPPNNTGRGRGSGTGGRSNSSYSRVTPGSQARGAPGGSDPLPQTSATPRGLCISALFEKYSLGSGCHRLSSGTCPFNHNVAAASKEDQRTAAGRVGKEDKRRQLLSAIG
jgi:hypothetical protein